MRKGFQTLSLSLNKEKYHSGTERHSLVQNARLSLATMAAFQQMNLNALHAGKTQRVKERETE